MPNNNGSFRWRPHVCWLLADLVVIIVILVVVNWGKYPNIVDRANLAATFMSLILAVLAIVYAFFSNESMSAAVGQLKSAADSVGENTRKLEGSLTSITNVVHSIPGRLDSFSSQLDELRSATRSQASPEAAPPIAVELANHFCRVSSMNGLKVLLAYKLSREKQREFDLREICNADGRMSYDYAYAYLVASVSVGFLAVAERGVYTKTLEIREPLRNAIEPAIAGRAQFLRQQGRPGDANQFEQDVQKVRDRFG